MSRLREFARALGLLFDLLAFSAFVGALIGTCVFFAKTIAGLAP